ncbi:MAG: hypothetical protein IH830_11010 [Planctomycetes bacterium]|nr:hypothetical protein [Planctomycetota bacterium]
MARKNQHTFAKRQRERKKAEKAAQKRARRDARKDPEAPPESQGDDLLPGAGEEAAEGGAGTAGLTSSPAGSMLSTS